jgi:hypothetical protein
MRYSVRLSGLQMKKPPSLAVSCRSVCVRCCVNPPLLHRLKAGMAKPKIAGKESSVAHGGSEKVEMTITLGYEAWQGFCRSASFVD